MSRAKGIVDKHVVDTDTGGLISGLHRIGTSQARFTNGDSIVGMDTTAVQTPATFVADDATDIITAVAHGLSNLDLVQLTTVTTLPAGLELLTNYFVRNKTDDTFQVSLKPRSAIIDITDTGTGDHTFTEFLKVILASADTLNGKQVVVKDEGNNATAIDIIIETEGSETIDGASSQTISTDDGVVRMYSDGSDWFLM